MKVRKVRRFNIKQLAWRMKELKLKRRDLDYSEARELKKNGGERYVSKRNCEYN